MTFNSYIFILGFLPVCLLGYYLLNYFRYFRLGLVFLTVMSLWFYGYFNSRYLVIICSSVIVNYMVYSLLRYIYADKRTLRKMIFIFGLAFNLGILGYYKYADFFIENINLIAGTDFTLVNILLPLGISFFTFQQISFITDVYRDTWGGIGYTFIEYACYVLFFPQLVAGPIVTHDVLVPQLQDIKRKALNFDYLAKGIILFTFGLAKKVLIADIFGNFVNIAYASVNELNSTTAFFAMLAYTLQIYFDFSGYSDMAIGLGWMMNIDLPVNFDAPYKALSVTEFWKRWHMTLTSFFTKYVYIPLGGNKKGEIRTYINIFIVFLLSGFWHGAGWTFVLWGILHGLAQILERLFHTFWKNFHPVFGWLLSFGFVNVSWIYFRVDSIADANLIIKKILFFDFGTLSNEMVGVFLLPEWEFLWRKLAPEFYENHKSINMMLYFVTAMVLILAVPNAKSIAKWCASKKWTSYVIAFLLLWCVFSFTGISTFLYFNF